MRRIVFAICTTITGLVLLLSYPTSLNRSTASAATTTDTGTTGDTTTTTPDTTTSDTTTGGTTGGTTSSDTATTTEPAAPASTTTTYTGAAASTRYGSVQVEITVTDGVVASAQAVDYPNGNGKDQQINAYAIPVLNKEATAAGSADIAMVSGATYTSDGYIQSLQDALDQAGL